MKLCIAIVAITCAAGAAQGGLTENFDAGIPASWTTVKYLATSPFGWTTNNLESRTNWTPPVGVNNTLCAHADSDHHAGNFDIGLISPAFSVPAGATIEYDTNYQNFANIDVANLDITTDGGGSWTTLLHWQEDHGAFQATPGVHVSVSLSNYVGQNAQVRWHYSEAIQGGFDWWWQVDNVTVTPAPAGAALLGLGALGIGRRRR